MCINCPCSPIHTQRPMIRTNLREWRGSKLQIMSLKEQEMGVRLYEYREWIQMMMIIIILIMLIYWWAKNVCREAPFKFVLTQTTKESLSHLVMMMMTLCTWILNEFSLLQLENALLSSSFSSSSSSSLLLQAAAGLQQYYQHFVKASLTMHCCSMDSSRNRSVTFLCIHL